MVGPVALLIDRSVVVLNRLAGMKAQAAEPSPEGALELGPGFTLEEPLERLNPMLIGDRTQLRRLEKLGFRPEEFDEVFARSGGPGGQNVNKVSTAVTLRHRGSGLAITAQDSRSQYRNRQVALERLISLLERRRKDERAAERAARERARRQRSPRPAGLKREIRESKQRRAEVKRTRRRVALPD